MTQVKGSTPFRNADGLLVCAVHPDGCRATDVAALFATFDVHFRDSRGGRSFDYITGEMAKTRRLEVLGVGGCSFQILDHGFYNEDAVWVKGEVTARIIDHDPNEPLDYVDRTVKVQQFGSAKIKRLRTGALMDIGFDMKAAATDCEKKCLAEIGVGLYLWHKGGGILTAPDDTVEDDWVEVPSDTPAIVPVNAPAAADAPERPAALPQRTAPRPAAPTPGAVGQGRNTRQPADTEPQRAASAQEISEYHLLAAEARAYGMRIAWSDTPEDMTNLQIANYMRLMKGFIEKRGALAS